MRVTVENLPLVAGVIIGVGGLLLYLVIALTQRAAERSRS